MCGKGDLVSIEKQGNGEIKKFSCGDSKVVVIVGISSELRMRGKGQMVNGIRTYEVKARKRKDFERRKIVERENEIKDTSVIMIDYNKGKPSHIHCKICDNQWRKGDKDLQEKFDIEYATSRVISLKCNYCKRKIELH